MGSEFWPPNLPVVNWSLGSAILLLPLLLTQRTVLPLLFQTDNFAVASDPFDTGPTRPKASGVVCDH